MMHLQQQLQAEQEMVNLRATMMSTISHELRTPLAVVISSADILERYKTKLTAQQYSAHVSKILLQADRLDSMIDELNMLAKAERGYLDVQLVQTDIKLFL